LLIGNDESSAGWLEGQLVAVGFRVVWARSWEQAISAGMVPNAGAIVFDINGRESPGYESARSVRDAGIDVPLIILSSLGSWRDRVESLDAGADDYLVKPARAEELLARLRAVIRRFAGCSSNRARSGDIEVEMVARQAWLAGQPLDLTRSEFRLLRLFMMRPEKIHSQQDIQDHLYAGIGESSSNSLEVQIGRLRRKIGKDRIQTVRGMGYRIVCDAAGVAEANQFA
jgi:two-component system OmpR family response regulator